MVLLTQHDARAQKRIPSKFSRALRNSRKQSDRFSGERFQGSSSDASQSGTPCRTTTAKHSDHVPLQRPLKGSLF